MLKKSIFLMLLACPLALIAHVNSFLPQAGEQPKKELPLAKGGEQFTHEEKQLVNNFWVILKNKRTAKTLEKILTPDFNYFDVYANLQNKKTFISTIISQFPQIQTYQISGLKLTRKGELIFAFYRVSLSTTATTGVLPLAQTNVFQKVHGKWKVKSYVNLNPGTIT